MLEKPHRRLYVLLTDGGRKVRKMFESWQIALKSSYAEAMSGCSSLNVMLLWIKILIASSNEVVWQLVFICLFPK